MPTLAEMMAAKARAKTAEHELAILQPLVEKACMEAGPDVEYVCEYAVKDEVAAALRAQGVRVAICCEPGKIARLFVGGWNDPTPIVTDPLSEPAPVEEVV